MYQKEEIERLAKKYVETHEEEVFEELIKALIPLIDVQLGKNYSSLKQFWDDLRQEVLLRICKNRGGLSTTKSKSLYQFLYSRIRTELNRLTTLRKYKDQWKSEEEKLDEATSLQPEEATIQHGDVTIIEFGKDGNEKNRKIVKPKSVKIKKGEIDYPPESLEAIERHKRANFERQKVTDDE